MGKQQSGFTLIELIAVIVILGILAATAVPRMVNLSDEAGQAAVKGVAGSIESGSALNHALHVARLAGLTGAVGETHEVIDNCQDGALLIEGGVPDGWTIASVDVTDQMTASCTLTSNTGQEATFRIIGAAALPAATPAT